METFSALLAICAGNSPVTGEFPAQRPVTRSFEVFFDLCLNKRLIKQSWCWWFETPSHPLWRHSNESPPIVRIIDSTIAMNEDVRSDYWRKTRYNLPAGGRAMGRLFLNWQRKVRHEISRMRYMHVLFKPDFNLMSFSTHRVDQYLW